MVIIGIDPGTATTGYGVVKKTAAGVAYIACGAILTDKSAELQDRLLTIYTQINHLFDTHKPDTIATERLFFSSNATTAMQVGRTLGVILLAAAQRRLPVLEYRPAEVKMAVTGYGAADKKQIQSMVKQLLSLDSIPKPDDAADALAIAICHAHSAVFAAFRTKT